MSDKLKIAMIDDEEELCLVVKANLEDTGEFEVVTCNDGKQAESFIKKENPDLILLDNIMPDCKGSEIVGELRKKGAETKGIPIIMVSGKGEMVYNKKKGEFKWMANNPMAKDRGDLPEARSAEALSEAYGVDDYVSKPFSTELLVDVIKDVIKRKRKVEADTGEEEPPV